MPSILTRPGGGGGGGQVTIGLSSATPDYNGSLTITATASGISPTVYTFQISDAEGGIETTQQASNVLVWTVNKVGTVTISVVATQGGFEAGATATATVTDPLNYAAKLADWNGKQGVTVVNGTVDTIADQSGNGYDLPTWTINSQPFYEASSGKIISQLSRLQNTTSNPLNGKSAFTIFFKACKFASPNSNQRLIGFGSTGIQFTIGLVGDATRDVLIGEANFSRYIGFKADIMSGNTVGFVKSGTNPFVAYVDGALAPIVISVGTPQASLPTDNGIHLFTQNGSINFNGMFDRIIIFDTDALTSTQIAAINERIKVLHP